jgi:hypothetical protein
LIFVLPWPAYIFAFTGYLVTLIGPRLSWNSIVMLPILTLAWAYYPHLLMGIRKVFPRLKAEVPLEEEKDE